MLRSDVEELVVCDLDNTGGSSAEAREDRSRAVHPVVAIAVAAEEVVIVVVATAVYHQQCE